MHIFTHLRPESQGKTGLGLAPDGMTEHDGHIGQLLKKLDDLKVAETKIEQREAQLAVRLGDLANEVTNSELSLKRAEMRITESETVPRVDRESAKIDVQGANIALGRTKSGLESARLEGRARLPG